MVNNKEREFFVRDNYELFTDWRESGLLMSEYIKDQKQRIDKYMFNVKEYDGLVKRAKEQPFKIGDRIELTESVDKFPDFIADKGLIGTVVYVDNEHKGMIEVKMDKTIKGAEHWDNCVIFYGWEEEVLIEGYGKLTPMEELHMYAKKVI